MSTLIETSVNIKIGVVERDERENGERRLLNFGHTVGHAIEISSGLKHGMAISCGMQIASAMSVEQGLLAESDHRRIVALLDNLGLISDCPELTTSIIDLVKRDKKREKKMIHFILLEGIGQGVIRAISINDLLKHLNQK
jgi:3-dehydroquinate synthase